MATYEDDDDDDYELDTNASSKKDKNKLQQEERAKFNLSVVYHELVDTDIISMSIQNNVLAILGKNNKILINDLDSTSADATSTYSITYNGYKLFLDPLGKHTLVSSTTGELFYFNPKHGIKGARIHLSSSGASAATAAAAGIFSAVAGAQQAKDLPSAVFIVESVGWDLTNTSTSSTGEILLGSKVGGMVYRMKIDVDKASSNSIKPPSVSSVDKLPKNHDPAIPIGSIEVARWAKRDGSYIVAVFLSTARRLYQGFAKNLVEAAKHACSEKAFHEHQDIPDTTCRGGFALFRPLMTSKQPQSWAWASTTGIRHGCFHSTDHIDLGDASTFATDDLVPFGKQRKPGFDRAPIDVALSAFHMYLLYEDRFVILNHTAGMSWKSKISGNDEDTGFGTGGGAASYFRSSAAAASPTTTASDPTDLKTFDFNERLRFDAFKNKKIRPLLGIVRDINRRKIYIYNATHIWDVEVEKESNGQWRLFLERALDSSEPDELRERYFLAAYGLTKKKPIQHSSVTFAIAKYYMELNRTSEASMYFSECGRFEDVILTLMAHPDQTLLLRFAERRLRLMKEKGVGGTEQQQQQQSQLAALLVLVGQLRIENYCATIDPSNAIRARGAPHASASGATLKPSGRVVKQAFDDLLSFWKETASGNKRLFDDKSLFTVFTRMLASQGCTPVMLELAESTERYRYSMDHYHNRGDYDAVAKILLNHCTTIDSPQALWFEFSPKLILHRPVSLFKGLYQLSKSYQQKSIGAPVSPASTATYFNTERLIPAFINYRVDANEDGSDDHQTIDYLSNLFRKNQLHSRVLHNMLIALLLKQVRECRSLGRDDEILIAELADVLRSENYTVEFALRKCIEADQRELCVVLYERLGMFEEAVLAALSPGTPESIDNAKEFIKTNVSGINNDAPMRKRLWLHVAQAVTKNAAGTREALDIIQESEGALRLEDVLSSFPDEQQVIQDFKTEICNSLDQYAKGIETLKKGMEEATTLAGHLKDDEIALKHQFGYITASQRCECCQKTLLRTANTRPFLVYPSCRHAFHEDCVEKLYSKLSQEERCNIAEELELDNAHDMTAFREAECPFCGEYMIRQCAAPFAVV